MSPDCQHARSNGTWPMCPRAGIRDLLYRRTSNRLRALSGSFRRKWESEGIVPSFSHSDIRMIFPWCPMVLWISTCYVWLSAGTSLKLRIINQPCRSGYLMASLWLPFYEDFACCGQSKMRKLLFSINDAKHEMSSWTCDPKIFTSFPFYVFFHDEHLQLKNIAVYRATERPMNELVSNLSQIFFAA